MTELFKIEKDLREEYSCSQLICLANFHGLNPQEPLDQLITKIAEKNSQMEFSLDKTQSARFSPFTPSNVLKNNINENLLVAIVNNDIVSIQTFLEQGVDLDTQNNNGTTLLHIASMNNHLESVKTLLSGGANPNIQDTFNRATPLHFTDNNAIIKALLLAGAKPNIPNKFGEPPRFVPEILEQIIQEYGSLEQAHQHWLESLPHDSKAWQYWQLSLPGRRVKAVKR